MSILASDKRYGIELASHAIFFRSISEEIENQADNILNYKDHPAMLLLRQDDSRDCYAKTQLYEALSYGDAGTLFASPRPCLTGLLLAEIGSKSQYNYYHEQVANAALRTCFAVTEPHCGSDISTLKTSLTYDNNSNLFYINGEKYLFGNGICADIGTIWLRDKQGPLGIRPVLIDLKNTHEKYLKKQVLPMLGLKAAQLSSFEFSYFPIREDCLIGNEVSPVKRGVFVLARVFNKMRVCIAALSIGHTQAICDYIYETSLYSIVDLNRKVRMTQLSLNELRKQMYQIANEIYKNPDIYEKVSLLKVQATKLFSELMMVIFTSSPSGTFFQHPYLAKAYRDGYAFEYTDGTTHIQNNNIIKGYNSGIFKTTN